MKSAIASLIMHHMTVANSIDWYFFAGMYDMTEVKQKAREIMYIDFDSVSHLPAFFALDYDDLVAYVTWQEVHCDAALDAACRWVMHDKQQRQNKFADILQAINITHCSASCLSHIMTAYGTDLIRNADLKDHILNAVVSKQQKWKQPGRGAGYDVIVLGGQNLNTMHCVMSRKSWQINLKTNATEERANFPSEYPNTLLPAMAVTSTGTVFIGGARSYKDGGFCDILYQCVQYNKIADTWELLENIPRAPMYLNSRAVCVGGNQIFVICGNRFVNSVNKMFSYNLTEKTWNTCPDVLLSLACPITGVVDQSIYVVNSDWPGHEVIGEGEDRHVQCFDTSTSTWSFKASLPQEIGDKCDGATAVSIGHQLYVVGGRRNGVCLRYDTREDVWAILKPSLEYHLCGAAVALNGKIFLCGGLNDLHEESDRIENYDPDTDTWTLLPVRLPKPLYCPCIIPLN